MANGLPTLTGSKLTLRDLRLSDAPSLLAMLATEEVARFISPPPTTVEGFERFIAWTHRERAAGNYICFAWCPRAPTRPSACSRSGSSSRASAPRSGLCDRLALLGLRHLRRGCQAGRELRVRSHRRASTRARAAVQKRPRQRRRFAQARPRWQEGILRKSFLRNGEYLDQVLWTIMDGGLAAGQGRLGREGALTKEIIRNSSPSPGRPAVRRPPGVSFVSPAQIDKPHIGRYGSVHEPARRPAPCGDSVPQCEVDLGALRAKRAALLQTPLRGIVVLDRTCEAPFLDEDESERVIRGRPGRGAGDRVLIAGTGANPRGWAISEQHAAAAAPLSLEQCGHRLRPMRWRRPPSVSSCRPVPRCPSRAWLARPGASSTCSTTSTASAT